MSSAPLLAGGAAVAGVLALWSALAAAEHGLAGLAVAVGPDGVLARVLAPLRARREPSRSDRRRLQMLGVAAVGAGGWLLLGPVAALLLAATAPLLASRLLAAAARRRREQLADAAPVVARALADALGGGHSVRGAIAEAAAARLAGPAGDELRQAAAALAVGEPTERVVERLRARAGHPAFDALTAAVLLQREAGGDLAHLLRSLAAALEEQVRAEAEARSLTAQARFTALLVALLPLGAAALAELGRPGYLLSLLSQPLSGLLVTLSAILQAAAWVAVRRISRVRR